MVNKEVTIEILLNEYNKYVMSRIINKDYDFNYLRQTVKQFSEATDLIEYNENLTNREVAENVEKFINKCSYKKIFEI